MSTRYQPTSRPSLRTFELGQSRPRFPISPPETERNAHAHSLGGPIVATPDGDKEESPIRHLRRAPSIHYNNTQAAPFARSQQTRSPRWLLVVLPPATGIEGEPALGHTLATGPPGRLQSGVLVPLFPTVSLTCLVTYQSLLRVDVRPTRCNCERVQLSKHSRCLPLLACLRTRGQYFSSHLR